MKHILSALYILLFSFMYTGIVIAQETIILDDRTEEIPIGKSLYYLKDNEPQLTFEQISSPEFEKHFTKSDKTAPNFGSIKVVWNKFKIVNHSHQKWFLTVENHNIDTLAFYYPDSGKLYKKIVLGNTKPFSERKYKINPYIFDLPVKYNDSVVFYLKVGSNFFQYPLNIVSEAGMLKKSQYRNIGLGTYFGFLLVIIFYGTVVYLVFKDRGYLFYILHVTLTGLMIFEREGLIAAIWDEKFNFFFARTSFFVALASASIYPFTTAFLETKRYTPILHKIIYYFLLPTTFIGPLFDLFGNKYIASFCNQAFGAIGLIFIYCTAIYIYNKGFKHARFYIIASSCYFIGVLIFILKTNAIIPHNSITNSALEIGSILEMILFSFSLGDKLNFVRRRRELAENKLRSTEMEKLSAEKSKEFKEQFLANMSHEIRTPMNAILGMTNLTLKTPISSKQKQYLTAIKKSSENLLVIINDILDLSKLEAGKMELEKISFHLPDVIQQVYMSMQFKAEEKGLQLITTIAPDVPSVIKGDPSRINQILINLIGNAIKFTSKGKISVFVEMDKEQTGFIRFRVLDSGIGIPEDKMKLLFQAFSQVNSDTSRKYGGTGLGLSISKTLIELHGGKIEVRSKEGEGSEFSFIIPLELGNKQEIETDTIQDSDASQLQGIRILVAEDNEYNQIVITDTLKDLIENATVEIAANGKVAIEKHLSSDFDVILMDMNMPEMNGIEATQYIREKSIEKKKDIPILALTANVMEKDTTKIFESGMNGFIPKPFTQNELISGLLKYYRKKEGITTKDTQSQKTVPTINIIPVEDKVTNLDFLNNFCGDDKVRMKKYIDMYLMSISDNLTKIEDAYIKQDYKTASATAHTIKPHFTYMGMHKAKEISETIENILSEKVNIDTVHPLLNQLKQLCEQSFNELKQL